MIYSTRAKARLFVALLVAVLPAWTQSAPTTATVKLKALHEKLQQRGKTDKTAVAALARKLGIESRLTLPNGKVLELQRIDSHGRPVFYITNNYDAADTVSTDEVWPGGAAGLNLTGNGMTIAEWDAGAVEVLHPDLFPRATQMDSPVAISDHATHVAGTLSGSGGSQYLQARGMAYEASLQAYDWIDDSEEMVASALTGTLVSNHSYAIATGWTAIGGTPPDNWWWFGGFGDEDPNFGYYNDLAQLWDQIAYDAPYYLIVKAAGNDRWDTGPEPGSNEEFKIVDQFGNEITTSTDAPPPDCGQDNYDCLPPGGVAKNILTVGAVDDVQGGYVPLAGPSSVQMTGFSSWGPADDGRIKPDLVANGWMLFSTYPWDPYFASAIGTSMAAPNVSGSLLLLQQHHESLHGSGNYMRAATLKALAIHTADETGDANGPDYEYGWGLLNTRKAAQLISDDGNGSHQIVEGSLVTGAADTALIDVTQDGARVTVTLVWNDPPATPVIPSLDPANLMLVNDLDLRATGNGDTHLPWVLNPAQPAAPASRGDNFRDNVEQVEFTASTGSYNLAVSHKGTLDSPQAYSLIISISPPAPVSTGLAIDEDFAEGTLPSGWTTQTNSAVDWSIRLPEPGNTRYENNTGGSGGFAMLDNDFANTIASLTLPALDLSGTESAVLRFRNSFPYYDTFETLNVETSVDGGSNWSNRWYFMGFAPFPFQESIDLTGAIAGQANVLIRFLWHSGGYPGGDAWQLDNVELETFGAPLPPPPPDPSGLPGQTSGPAPAPGSSNVSTSVLLTWSAGSLAESHKVYLSTDSSLSAADYRGDLTSNQYDPGMLAGTTTFYWRVDEVNTEGETEGITWSFTTETPPTPPTPPATPTMHIGDIDGVSNPQPRNRWQAQATLLVRDDAGLPLASATISGLWSNGANGSQDCITNTSGVCTIAKDNLKSAVSSVTLGVTAIVHSGYDYLPGANNDADGDSDGTIIGISQNSEPPTNTAPVTTITSPADDAVFSEGTGITLSANAQDAESGNLSSVITWKVNGVSIGSGANKTHDFAGGSHTVQATATDPEGASGSDGITITVGGGGGGGGSTPTITSLADQSTAGSKNWSAIARVVIEDGSGSPLSSASVSGSWSNGAKGGASCTTAADGSCLLAKQRLKLNVDSVRITVNSVSISGVSIEPDGANTLILMQ